eukprot:SAG11_NODE_476_length_9118_cov_5.515911_3_plen_58_part_00
MNRLMILRSEQTKAKITAAWRKKRIQTCFEIRDFDQEPLLEGELRCQFSDNVLQMQC